ncbi:MAG TPA: LytR C-terminal domain-containing protein [Solirubrobacteraceae bacterium]|jgi:hypothetical protein|nr:LytR C-terminal domain-containing protein [Solirubrobacteraceae bacterium]
MATIPFALSISHLVSSAGADVGFAAILGLAILVLLFFSQARETATLRRRADEAEDQLRQLAAYVEQMSRTRSAPAPAPSQATSTGTVAPVPPPAAARVAARQVAFPAASRPVPASAPAAAAGGGVATIPAAPAGVGAPALSAATRLIPLADADSISIRPMKNGDAGAPAPNGPAGSAAAPVPAVEGEPAGPPPSTAAGGANGAGRAPVAPAPAPPPADVPPPRIPLRREGSPVAGRPAAPPTFRDPVPPSGRRFSRVALVIASVVAVAAIIAVVLVISNGGSSPKPASTATSRAGATRSSKRSRHHGATAVAPSSVSVAVLNGTGTPLLAADIMAKLTSAGYKQGAKPTNAPSQTLTSTIVGYTQPSYRAAALAVAKSLNLGSASVQGVAPGDRAAACHTTTAACSAQVVVSVGSDLASSASSASTGASTG